MATGAAMAKASNPHNTFTGPNALVDYHDPDCQPPLPLVEIPDKLNPFRKDGVRIYAKMLTMLPVHNVKSLPALRMLQRGGGVSEDTKTIVEYSSGSTVISMAVLARVLHNIDDVRAFLSNKTSDMKIKLMRLFGLEITLFGGPSQPEPTDPRGGIQKARMMAEEDETIFNPNQYENHLNYTSHISWTGPQIMRQLPGINVFCAGMGTSGTMTGIGTHLKGAKPSIHRIGVCTAPGDRVPGPRSYALLGPVEFPWQDAVDSIEETGSMESFSLSMELTRQGLVCGPSSGFNLSGLHKFLQKRKNAGTLKDLAGKDGEVHCVFVCCDLPYQYIEEYFDKLGEEFFPPIINKNLVGVDKYRYDEAWELAVPNFVEKLYPTALDILRELKDPLKQGVKVTVKELGKGKKGNRMSNPVPPVPQLAENTTLLDFRSASAFSEKHLPGAINLPLSTLSNDQPSPFEDSSILERQWLEIDKLFSKKETAMNGHSSGHSEMKGTATDKPRRSSWINWVPGLSPGPNGSGVDPNQRSAVVENIFANSKSERVVCVDYGGDTARVATSVLRARGLEAWSLRGGMKKWDEDSENAKATA